ncbi:efflux RND transporter periplasmic adaptor subunit [Chitinophaga sedimenti]|uniref:efflux RND transporter periplasmic adaptor subunit n=1 Tax=Chitinophaga sedimenti TaxID=2033606 RepID=UPI00200569C6|nr:efflux RND transporter periplasmic adaptor subunit [Chitinophaga sedimenti]MCK7558559.1 efflux RND transporter periplasmic adaptor subunit [Chitinophaga sedimenti]
MEAERQQKENVEKTEIVKTSNSGAVPVLVEKAAKTEFDRQFTANGNFAPVRELTYLSETSGRITKLLVDEGSFVSQGAMLARVDDELLSTDLKSSEVNMKQLKVDMERNEAALKNGGVTQKQYDDAKLQYELAIAKVESANRRVKDTYVKAPIQGTINKKYVELGSYLTPGTKMFDIVDVSRLKLAVSVPEAQVINLKVGQSVKVTSNVYPEVNYTGKITFIASKGDATLNYPVEMEIANVSGKALKAGMYGTAQFEMPKMDPAILVARTAFVGGVNSNNVYVMEGEIAKLRKVVAGRIFGDRVEVREGLSEGDIVITSGQINLADGSKVTVQK